MTDTIETLADEYWTAYLTDNPEGLHHLDGRVVVTANPTELARMSGREDDETAERGQSAEQAHLARRQAQRVTEAGEIAAEATVGVTQIGRYGSVPLLRSRQTTATRPSPWASAPYLAALVASSWKRRPRASAWAGESATAGPASR